jgi:hypothetical protein
MKEPFRVQFNVKLLGAGSELCIRSKVAPYCPYLRTWFHCAGNAHFYVSKGS